MAGTPAKTMTGARAVVKVNGSIVGIFETCTYNRSYGTEAIHILGQYSAVEIPYTSAEAVTLSCSGFRVVDFGVFVGPGVPTIGELLNFEPMTVDVTDRQSGKIILSATGVVPNGDNGNFNARATSRVTVNYIGLIVDDETSLANGTNTDGKTNWP